ncbi:hypothetical protein LRP52_38365 [Photobacterium sp. ZSDE20]|uniref:Uncharacterized protein n=1 Tax=Photobacterium pectinilyticum TaxID=2906793 RepID=A0ABT1N781_9GAMM|nr:hypothetical protein [Photobacterium sp. ZSDE20]MCQ1060600.1 hypothetical protein [Photobacterium sp. ZSDE20]MDD1828045.1 hypothetical protein [Photobacterium sp. ZSDE20]
MGSEQELWAFSGLAGALGGLCSYMLFAYHGFDKFITKDDIDKSKEQRRGYTLVLRVLYGAFVGCLISFYFMDDMLAGNIGFYRAVFWAGVAGFSTNILTILSNSLKKLTKV